MARAQRIVCDSCGSPRITAGTPFCGACGRPTVWATHQERTDWEVQQWRKARPGTLAETGAILTMPRKSAPSAAPPAPAWDGFLTPGDPPPSKTRPARERRGGPGFAAMIKRAFAGLRRMFATSAMVALDAKPMPQPAKATVDVAREQAPQPEAPPRMALVPNVAEEALAEAPPSQPRPTPARKAPSKPRKRPAPPTNKDMLKQTLSVLTKVERRLEQLEQEVAGIDDAVRKVSGASGEDQAAVGE